MSSIINYYGLYDSINEAFERVYELVDNNWIIEEKIYLEEYLEEKNKESKLIQVLSESLFNYIKSMA